MQKDRFVLAHRVWQLTVEGFLEGDDVPVMPSGLKMPELFQMAHKGLLWFPKDSVTRGWTRSGETLGALSRGDLTHAKLKEKNKGKKVIDVVVGWYAHTCLNWGNAFTTALSNKMFEYFCQAPKTNTQRQILGLGNEATPAWQCKSTGSTGTEFAFGPNELHWGRQLPSETQDWIISGGYMCFNASAGDSIQDIGSLRPELIKERKQPLGDGGLFAVIMKTADAWQGVGLHLFLPWLIPQAQAQEQCAETHARMHAVKKVLMLQPDPSSGTMQVAETSLFGTRAMATLFVYLEAAVMGGSLAGYGKFLKELQAGANPPPAKDLVKARMNTLQKYLNQHSCTVRQMYETLVTTNNEFNALGSAMQRMQRSRGVARSLHLAAGASGKAQDLAPQQSGEGSSKDNVLAKGAKGTVSGKAQDLAQQQSGEGSSKDKVLAKGAKRRKVNAGALSSIPEASDNLVSAGQCPGCQGPVLVQADLPDPSRHCHHCHGCGKVCHSPIGCQGISQHPDFDKDSGKFICNGCAAERKKIMAGQSPNESSSDSDLDDRGHDADETQVSQAVMYDDDDTQLGQRKNDHVEVPSQVLGKVGPMRTDKGPLASPATPAHSKGKGKDKGKGKEQDVTPTRTSDRVMQRGLNSQATTAVGRQEQKLLRCPAHGQFCSNPREFARKKECAGCGQTFHELCQTKKQEVLLCLTCM